MLHLPPNLAQDIFRMAHEDDPVAMAIIDTSAQELGQNVNAVIRQLGFEDQSFELVLIGSVFKSGELFLRPFRKTVYSFAPAAKLVHLSVPPVSGSILLAAEAIGINPISIRHDLNTSIKDFIDLDDPESAQATKSVP
jgi:N-acetylglucosamine kinase-like BadF-type ATPase